MSKTIEFIKSAEETKRKKALNLRYKKPIVKNLNYEHIVNDLWDMQEKCEEIRWYTDSEDGEDSLINALDGDEDEAFEFRMAFADLCAECDKMEEDLSENEPILPECFDIFFVAVGAGETYGGLLGFDTYEGDYFGLGDFSDGYAEDEAKKKLKRATKDEIISAARQCFRIYNAYIGLRTRYDRLDAAIDILRDQNTGILQTVKEIDRMYEEASKDDWSRNEWDKASREWKRYTDILPEEAWVM